MTITPPELELSPAAAARLEEYLVQVRAALAGAADVNADDIDADVREHVENELSAAPRPVPLPVLEAVLTKLGPPSQWGAGADPTALRRAANLLREHLRGARVAAVGGAQRVRLTLIHGPEDWRLTYLSFGLFALGLITMVAFPLALVVCYLLSRAGIVVAREKGVTLGTGQKWLLYPPVVLVSAALLGALVAVPVVLGGVTFSQVEQARDRVAQSYRPAPLPSHGELRKEPSAAWQKNAGPQLREDRALLLAVPVAPKWAAHAAGLFVGFGALVGWGAVLGALGASFPGAVRAAFYPLCNGFERTHGTWLTIVCFVLLLPWLFAAYEVVVALV